MVVRELVTKLGYALDQGKLKTYEQSARNVAKRMAGVGRSMTTFVTLPIVAAASAAVNAYSKQNQALAQVRTGLESTRFASGKTLEELKKQASDLQENSLFGDEQILQEATAQLLTFTNIAGEEFDRVQQAVLDVSSRMKGPGSDLTSVSLQLGKALNDPVKNLSALSRSGIQFSKDQIALIKSLAESGRMAEAQAVILTELEAQYSGSAKAAADASVGWKQMANAIGDVFEEFGEVLYPYVKVVTEGLKAIAKWLGALPKPVKTIIIVLAALVAAIGPLLLLGAGLLSIVVFFIAHAAIVVPILVTISGVLGIIATSLLTIVAPAAIILLILQDIATWLQGGESVFGGFVGPVELFMDNVVFWLDKIKTWFGSTWKNIVGEVTAFFDNVMMWVDKVVDFFSGIGGKIAGLFGFDISGGGDTGDGDTAPAFPTFPAFAGASGAAAFAGAGASNSSVSVQGGPINITLPPGISEERVDSLASTVSRAVEDSLTTHSRRVVKSNVAGE